MKLLFLYKTTNIITNEYYIGIHSTKNINDGYLGSGKKLRESIKKYGKDNHILEIIEYFNNKEDLFNKEKEIVNKELLKDSLCMNLTIGGLGEWTERAKQGLIRKLKEDLVFRERWSKQCSDRLKKTHSKGKIKYPTYLNINHSEETKKKIGLKSSINQKGKGNSQYGTCWINNGIENKKIRKEELLNFLSNDWIKGRKMSLNR